MNANKERKEKVIQIHFRKERFPEQRNSKLLPRGEGPFSSCNGSTIMLIILIFLIRMV
ncbi:hypothetical protein LINPERPRIM_LOCUS742 [Linum perenne]